MKRLTLSILLPAISIVSACSETLFQTNDSSNRQILREAPEKFSEDFISSMECTSAGKTEAKLLSSEVINGDPNNEFQYEITLTDCDGKPKGLEAKYLLFDIKAILKTYNPKGVNVGVADVYKFNYKIENEQDLNGSLEEKVGQDLFGQEGSNKLHWRSNRDFSFPKTQTSFLLTVYLNGLISFPEDGPEGFIETEKLEDEFMIDTYLRLGRALPVKVTVPFKNVDKEKISETTVDDKSDDDDDDDDTDNDDNDTKKD